MPDDDLTPYEDVFVLDQRRRSSRPSVPPHEDVPGCCVLHDAFRAWLEEEFQRCLRG